MHVVKHRICTKSQFPSKPVKIHSARLISEGKSKLYDKHIKLSTLQKGLVALGSAVHGVLNPERGDMIANLGETTGEYALRNLHQQMLNDPVGSEILHDKPIISSKTIKLDHLRNLRPETFGRSYAKFLDSHDFNIDDRAPVRFIDDPELAYVMLRYRQVHDFWHVLSGLETSVAGEIAVKVLEFQVTGLPMTALSTFAITRLPYNEIKTLTELVPWAFRCGSNCKNLMSVYYEKHFDMDLQQFRELLNFEKAPYSL